jgi:RNA polymerase sigma-70 factor, ECF subfamily
MAQDATAIDNDELRRLLAAGRVADAAASLLRAYGPEVYRFLAALHRAEADASDVFAMTAEGALRGLPTFAWQCTPRTWLYAVARRSSLRYRRDARRREARVRALPEGSALSNIADEIQSRTQTFLRTERRTRLEALRGLLPEADQELLLLRVGRQLGWDEIARVLGGENGENGENGESGKSGESPEGGAVTEVAIKREAARLRKRFQLVKA